MLKKRNVDKNTPIWILQQLWSGSRTLEARVKDHTITIRRLPKTTTIVLIMDGDEAPVQVDVASKEERRKILHRIWRWQQKTKWRTR